jgi:hypothetical protein
MFFDQEAEARNLIFNAGKARGLGINLLQAVQLTAHQLIKEISLFLRFF